MTDKHVSCGRDYSSIPDILEVLQHASGSGYDFICVPIANPRFKRDLVSNDGPKRPGAFTKTDLLLPGSDFLIGAV